MSLLTERAAHVLAIALIDETECNCGHPLKHHSLFRSVCEPLRGKACRCKSFEIPAASLPLPPPNAKSARGMSDT